MKLAPIVLFTYNRPWHTQVTIEALLANEEANDSELIIYSDASKNENAEAEVKEVRAYLKTIQGFKSVRIIEREDNLGLARSIISGATEVLKEYGRVIVLEDDLVTSKYFLKYMNGVLNYYKNRKEVFSVSGFTFSRKFMGIDSQDVCQTYVHYRPMSWSWGTWIDRWNNVDWSVSDYECFMQDRLQQKKLERGGKDLTNMLRLQMEGKIDSWYIRWSYECCKRDLINIYPTISFVNNTGHDGTGVHSGDNVNSVHAHNDLSVSKSIIYNDDLSIDEALVSRFNESFNPPFLERLRRKILKLKNS